MTDLARAKAIIAAQTMTVKLANAGLAFAHEVIKRQAAMIETQAIEIMDLRDEVERVRGGKG